MKADECIVHENRSIGIQITFVSTGKVFVFSETRARFALTT